ncbi:hypothetical protein PNQ92_03980 [Halobacterium salinarum]|uniref:HVO_0649 family zinc finger protein n=1 Tax=Halobacterium salinarum TaxID=2242 RepID=UPI002554ED34|nr:HVO_0649 family zinc finger protein [Halobacterium salinarum]MDL0124571.1 hypothetical protein [Halobacterium salinarum]
MAATQRGTTALDRMRSRLERVDMTCSGCGYEDEAGCWESVTDGSHIRYRRVCPCCGRSHDVTYRL